ncbi:F0F1 ATP synthase subunit alpha [Candidatus Azambacteria bacterium]|nr:F0F1 ATP synthase subunit alpha [Candidatus Azambacteria bacterium]
MNDFIVEKLKKEIEKFSQNAEVEKVGAVTKVADGICEIDGLERSMMSEMVVFSDKAGKTLAETLANPDAVFGLILNLEEGSVKAVILGDARKIREGMTVKSTGQVLSVPASEGFIGRVVNALGEPIDDAGSIKAKETRRIERIAYGVMDRSPVNTPLHTGLKAIDSMIPIGRGQRELIIGDRYTGKTTIAIDTILNQKNEPEAERPICIYVAIGQKASKTARIVNELKEKGAMDYTIVVSASSSEPAPMQFLAPFSGVAIAEYFMEKGKDVLIVYDDLSKQAVAYRQMSLVLRRPPGREAYPGDIFYLHSRLLERSAKLNKSLGGGSITALPIIETQEGDVSAYIPTNVISITDGQIFLNSDLFNKGLKPAIDVGISVSRVGSAAQTKAVKKVSGKIKLQLAQFRELEAFMQFSQDLDPETKASIEKGRRLVEVLKQKNGNPLGFEKQTVAIYAAINGMFDGVEVRNVVNAEEKLLSYIENQKKDIFDAIRKEKDLSKETEEKMKMAIADFKDTHGELFTIK